MIRIIIATLLLTFCFSTSIVHAYKLKEEPTVIETGREVILEIVAEPAPGENVVSINLLGNGLEITNYSFLVTGDWITKTDDCANDRNFSTNSVCVTLVKGSDIVAGESLGLITTRVTDLEKYSLIKVENGGYSNGSTFRQINGHFFSSEEPIPETVQEGIDPLLLIFGVGLLISAIVLLGGLAIYLTRKK